MNFKRKISINCFDKRHSSNISELTVVRYDPDEELQMDYRTHK